MLEVYLLRYVIFISLFYINVTTLLYFWVTTTANQETDPNYSGFVDSTAMRNCQWQIYWPNLVIKWRRLAKSKILRAVFSWLSKPKPRKLHWPITKNADKTVIQSKLEANRWCWRALQKNVLERLTIGFGLLLMKKSCTIFLNQSLSLVIQCQFKRGLLLRLKLKSL